jgi:hypothetical protein
VKDPIVVREGDGKWSSGYAKIMEDMSTCYRALMPCKVE